MTTLAKRIASAYLAKTGQIRKTAGAVDFEVYIPVSDAKKAFLRAKDEVVGSRWDEDDEEDGGYTGTILEKDSFQVRAKTPVPLAKALAFARRDFSKNDKWDPAFAVPVSGPSGGKIIGWVFYGIASS